MDAATLANAMGNRAGVDYNRWCGPFNRALIDAQCNTVDRVAMFCAQVGEESGGLEWMVELGSGAEYEGRADLGNTRPGDGERFKGRGPIQITGRNNYARLSQWAYSKGYAPTPTYFVDNPDQLAADQYVFLGPVWYWTVARPMNSYADRADIRGATIAVNGGLNGLADRTARWNHARTLGKALLPTKVHKRRPVLPRHHRVLYVVRSGETLSGIAANHYLTVKQLVRLNRWRHPFLWVNRNRLRVGEKLRVR